MVLGQGMSVVVIGLGIGLVLALGIGMALTSLLYGVGRFDMPTFGTTAAILFFVALIANYLPARRTTNVDPVDVMGYE